MQVQKFMQVIDFIQRASRSSKSILRSLRTVLRSNIFMTHPERDGPRVYLISHKTSEEIGPSDWARNRPGQSKRELFKEPEISAVDGKDGKRRAL